MASPSAPGQLTDADEVSLALARVVELLEQIAAALARIEERQERANELLDRIDRTQWS
ncbi:MAG: hypothetical protein KatS3mg012_1816 [Gaiellaceae bacterium]|jgi:hypothetical protein|nr:MAG: hypothetical protein KatS3mg012_1816 [Gaiellaceae bacterium]